MKNLKFAFLSFSIIVLAASCTKEDSLEVKDDSKFTPTHTTVKTNQLVLGKSTFTNIETTVVVSDSEYIMVLTSPAISAATGLLSTAIQPKQGETTLGNGQYAAVVGFEGISLSQNYISAYGDWVNNGADPTKQPSVTPDFYNTGGLTFSVSNLIANTGTEDLDSIDVNGNQGKVTYIVDKATITIGGYLVDSDGNQIPVSAVVDAKILRGN